MNLKTLQNKRKSIDTKIRDLLDEYNRLPNGNCYECSHFDRGSGNQCTKFNQIPPNDFIANPDCEYWQHDGFPCVLNNAKIEDFEDNLPF